MNWQRIWSHWKSLGQQQKQVILATAGSATIFGGTVWWAVWSTVNSINKIVAAKALDRERRGAPEFLYYNDPAFELRLREDNEQDYWFMWPYIGRRISRWRRTIWRRYLHVCCEGELHERIKAVNHLKKISHLEAWESAWVSQRLDAQSAVNLARSGAGKNRKLLRTPPLPPQCQQLNITHPLSELANKYPDHTCLAIYIQQYNEKLQDIHRHMEHEAGGTGGANQPSHIDNDDILLHSLLEVFHHFDMIPNRIDKSKPDPCEVFANAGGLVFVYNAANSERRDLQVVAARMLLKFSTYPSLLNMIHRTGLLENLSEWYDGDDAELKCIAAGALAGMESGNEDSIVYTPTVQLLHPVNRTISPPSLDVITVHGLLGEPFVTWRQRDRDPATMFKQKDANSENLILDSESDDFEMILRDIPESAQRDPILRSFYQRNVKGLAQLEKKELTEYTRCWPRDWLPKDCPNIRVLGVSYDTVMTEWGEPCEGTAKNDGLSSRASRLTAALRQAGVGTRPIVWITHSMGGLIVKQILVDSLESNSEKEHDIANQTKGIVFFSTPHHGSRAAHILLWPSREVQDLREDCATLGKLHKKWLAGKWPCICVAEGKPTKILSIPGINPTIYLVPPKSADAGVGPFYTLPLDHMDTCKPATRHSFIYRIVVDMVRHAKGDICTLDECEHCTKKRVEIYNKSIFKQYMNWVLKYFNKNQYDIDNKSVNN